MKKTALKKDMFREISRTRARFISIFLLVALAVAFLAGLRMTEPSMTKTADEYADDCSTYDIRIISTLGITSDDETAALALPEVDNAEATYSFDALTTHDNTAIAVKTMSIPEKQINGLHMISGRMPEADNECVADYGMHLQIGDKLELDPGEGRYENALKETKYTVVGLCSSPLFLSYMRGTTSIGNGKLSGFIYLKKSVYDMDAYTDMYLTLSGLKELNSFEEPYKTQSDDFVNKYEGWADERAALRTQSVLDEANEKLDEGQQEYDDAKAEADEKLSDAEKELADARTELDDGWKEYEDGKEELKTTVADAEEEIADAEKKLEDARIELIKGEGALEDAGSKLKNGEDEYNNGLSAFEAGRAQHEEGLAAYNEQKAKYDEGVTAYEAGMAQYDEGVAAYDEGKAQYDRMIAAINEYDQSKAALAAAEQELDAAYAEWEKNWAIIVAAGLEDSEEGLKLQALKQVLDEKKNELEAGKAQLAANEPTIEALRASAPAAEEKLMQSKAELDAAKKQLDDTKVQLDSASTRLNDAKAQLDEAGARLESSKAELDQAKAQLDGAREAISKNRSKLDNGWEEYYTGLDDIKEAKETLAEKTSDAQKDLDDALTKLTDGEKEYEDGLAEYEEKKAEADEKLADAEQKLADARKDISNIKAAKWYVLDRSMNQDFASYAKDAENMGNLATVFPLIFFLVAALVVLTTMTRMVEEQRTTIGVMKALGYSAFDISKKYVGYGFAASFFGSLFGLAVGCTTIPFVIISCWQIMYSVPEVIFDVKPLLCVFSSGVAILVTVLTVLSATLNALKAVPASLMRPRTPKAGKRFLLEKMGPIWRHLSFTRKVTIRNLLRYQKRFWMTVIGIGGCTALVITGFGLDDSISSIIDIQYKEVTKYHASAVLDKEDVKEAEKIISEDREVADYAMISQGAFDLINGHTTVKANYITVNSADDLDEMINLRTRVGHEAVKLSGSGIVICEKLSDMLGVEVGDIITIDNETRAEARIEEIVENYIGNYVYMTNECYESLFGKRAEINTAIIRFNEDSADTANMLGKELLADGCVSSYDHLQTLKESIEGSFGTINYGVLIIIISAAALAFVVLFNLSNINITERRRELATLQVLGFRDVEMGLYVLRENIILTLFGTLLGLIIGKWLHAFVIRTVEIEMIMFRRNADTFSYILAVIITFAFSMIVNVIAGLKLKKIDMVESLKGVE